MCILRRLVALLLLAAVPAVSHAKSVTLNPVADVYITTFGGGEGGNSFLKFDISGIEHAVIDSAFLEVYVWQADVNWDGDMVITNSHSQEWDEAIADSTLANYAVSGSTFQIGGFGDSLGWTRSSDISTIIARDNAKRNRYTSLRLKDPDDPTTMPMMGDMATDSDDTMKVGNIFSDLIYFYPSEHDSMPRLTIYYTTRGPVAGDGHCLNFDGTDNYVRVPDNSTLDLDGNVLSVSAWIKTDGNAAQTIVAKRDDSDWSKEPFWQFGVTAAGYLTAAVDSTAQDHNRTTGTIVCNDTAWHHVVMVCSGGDIDLYVDGVQADTSDSVAGSGGTPENENRLFIGAYINGAGAPADLFTGQIDEVSVWSKVLTPSDILALKKYNLDGNETDLAGHWRFDQPCGTALPGWSDNNNHGDVSGITDSDWYISGARSSQIVRMNDSLTLAAGYDPDGTPVSLKELTAPGNGTLLADSAALEITFVPSTGWTGNDTFSYSLTDTGGLSDSFTVYVTVDALVPVVLSFFIADWTGEGIILSWETLSERNNFGFEVLRSGAEGGPYQKLTRSLIPGAGTTSGPSCYTYLDRSAGAGTWFYILVQVDAFGSREYSNPISVTVQASAQNDPLPPVTFNLSQHCRITLRDGFGRIIYSATAPSGIYYRITDGKLIKVLVTRKK